MVTIFYHLIPFRFLPWNKGPFRDLQPHPHIFSKKNKILHQWKPSCIHINNLRVNKNIYYKFVWRNNRPNCRLIMHNIDMIFRHSGLCNSKSYKIYKCKFRIDWNKLVVYIYWTIWNTSRKNSRIRGLVKKFYLLL